MSRVPFDQWLVNTKHRVEQDGFRLVRVVLPETMEGPIMNDIARKCTLTALDKRTKMSGSLRIELDGVHVCFDHRVHPTRGQGCLLYMVKR